MILYDLSNENCKSVAELMSRIKPEFWDFDSALKQITAQGTIGWYLADDSQMPLGWMCVRELELLSSLELDCFGYNNNGSFSTEGEMADLFDKAEQHAVKKGFRIVRTTMTSLEMSCHNRDLGNYADELYSLKSCGRKYYGYLLQRGYKPAGFLPHCYGVNFHGIIMIKRLI